MRDIWILIWTVSVLGVVGVVSYAIDDLRQAHRHDDLNRELEELMKEEK